MDMNLNRRSPSKSLPLAFTALTLLGATACAPGIYLHRLRPAPHNLGAVRRLAVVEVAGPPEATGVVWAALSRQITDGGWFQLYARPAAPPAAAPPMPLESAGPPQPSPPSPSEAVEELSVVVQVLQWDLDESTSVEKHTQDGKEVHRHFRQATGRVRLGLQVIDAASNEVVFAGEFGGTATGPKVDAREAVPNPFGLMEAAGGEAVGDFLRAITPRTVEEKMVLDADEPSLKAGVALCKDGQLEAAMDAFQRVLDESQGASAGATYNLGVLWEARGQYARAEDLYRRALARSPKALYRDALDDLHRRIAEEAALRRHP
jgi:hypothetical protein